MTDNLESDKPDTSNEEVALLAEKKNEDASDKKEQEKENVVIKFLRLNKSFRIPALSVFILLILVIIAGLGDCCGYVWLTPLGTGGFVGKNNALPFFIKMGFLFLKNAIFGLMFKTTVDN
jgi:hypothetical protein